MTSINWGFPDGIPAGSDFTLEAVLTLNGAKDSALVSEAGSYTLTVSDSVLNGGVDLLTDEISDANSTSAVQSGTLVTWQITDLQSDTWEAGTYDGDIKLTDSALSITYWPVTIKIREAHD